MVLPPVKEVGLGAKGTELKEISLRWDGAGKASIGLKRGP